jgi:hypothetical protein
MIRDGEASLPKWGISTPNCILAMVLEPQKDKSEIRISKFETNRSEISQTRINSKTRNPNHGCLEHCVFWSFEFVSSFVLRSAGLLSCFEFFVLGAFAQAMAAFACGALFVF